jgi:hypothetical protein
MEIRETEIKSFMKRAFEGEGTFVSTLTDIYNQLPPDKKTLFRKWFYDVSDLSGIPTGQLKYGDKGWTDYHLKRMMRVIQYAPFDFYEIVNDLATYSPKKSQQIAKELILEYEHHLKEENIKEKMGFVGYGAGLLSIPFEIASSIVRKNPAPILRLVARLLGGTSGATLIAKSIYEAHTGDPFWKSAFDFLTGVGGVIWGLEKGDAKNLLYNVDSAYKRWMGQESRMLGKTILKMNENQDKIITQVLQKKNLKPAELLQEVASTITPEQYNALSYVLQIDKAKAEIFSLHQILQEEYETLVPLLKNMNPVFEKLNKQGWGKLQDAEKKAIMIYDARNKYKLLSFLSTTYRNPNSKYLVKTPSSVNIMTADDLIEGQEILLAYMRDNPVEIYKLAEPQQKMGVKTIEIQGNTYPITRQSIFRPDYHPTYAIPTIIRYKDKEGKVRVKSSNEFELEQDLYELIDAGHTIVDIKDRNPTRIFTTQKFSAEIEKIVKDKIKSMKKDEIARELAEDLRTKISDFWIRSFVYELPKKTKEGFIKDLGDELYVNHLIHDLYSKAFGIKVPLLRLRETFKQAEEVSVGAKLWGAILDDVLNPSRSTIDEFQSFIKRTWLTAHFPVRAINTLSIPLILFSRSVGNGADVKIAEEIASLSLKAIGKGITKADIEELRTTFPYRALTSNLYHLTKAPFEGAINKVADEIVKNPKYLKALFPNLPDDANPEIVKDFLKTFILADTSFAKPNFFFYKVKDTRVEDIINKFSAFFTNNYVPFVNAIKPYAVGLNKIMFGKPAEKFRWLGTLTATTLANAVYGALVGMRMAQPFSMIYQLASLQKQVENLLLGDAEFQDFRDDLANPLIRNTFLSLHSFLNEYFGDLLGADNITKVVLGNGLIGGLLGWGTQAGALGIPDLLSSPLLQGVMQFSRNLELFKRTAEEEGDIRVKAQSLLKTAQDLSGIYKRIAFQFFDQYTSLARIPSERGFIEKLYDVFFPRPTFTIEGIPPVLQFRDKEQIAKLRKSGIDGIHYFFNVKGKVEKRDPEVAKRIDERVITAFKDTLEKVRGEKRSRKILKAVKEPVSEDDEKNLIYLGLLLEKMGYKAIDKIPRAILEKHLDYAKELEQRIDVGKATAFWSE